MFETLEDAFSFCFQKLATLYLISTFLVWELKAHMS